MSAEMAVSSGVFHAFQCVAIQTAFLVQGINQLPFSISVTLIAARACLAVIGELLEQCCNLLQQKSRQLYRHRRLGIGQQVVEEVRQVQETQTQETKGLQVQVYSYRRQLSQVYICSYSFPARQGRYICQSIIIGISLLHKSHLFPSYSYCLTLFWSAFHLFITVLVCCCMVILTQQIQTNKQCCLFILL